MVEIVPAILARTPEELEGMRSRIDGLTEWIQIDLVDGEFAGNRTVTPEDLGAVAFQSSLEIHLMVKDVEGWLERLGEIAAPRVIVPVESLTEIEEPAEKVRRQNREFGLGINPETDLETIIPYLDQVDRVLILSVQPGYQGQGFRPESLGRIKEIRSRAPELPIEVDGGITPEVVPGLVQAGATTLVVGHDLLATEDPAEELTRLQEAAEGAR